MPSGGASRRKLAAAEPHEIVATGPASLVDLPQRVAPPGAVVESLRLREGTDLRMARWLPPADAPPRGTVLICTGRGEFIEKYFEVVGDLRRRGFATAVFDWRGQGLSSRALHNARKGHVADFACFDRDLRAVVRKLREAGCPRPFFGLAHSMGGTVMLRHAKSGDCAFERIVLSAPMVEIDRLPAGPALHVAARLLTAIGLGSLFVPSGRRTAVFDNGFRDNLLTSDPARFADMMGVSRAEPRLTVDAPTIGWLRAALDAMAPFRHFDYPARLAVPILMIVPGDDRVVTVAAMERFGQRLKAGTVVTVPGARHEILMERDALREQFWAAFDAFVPGSGAGDEVRQPRAVPPRAGSLRANP